MCQKNPFKNTFTKYNGEGGKEGVVIYIHELLVQLNSPIKFKCGSQIILTFLSECFVNFKSYLEGGNY